MNVKIIALVTAIAFSVWFSSCTATRVSHWRKLKATSSATFNVLDYGAKGDGHADDTQVIFHCFPKWVQLYFFFHHFSFQMITKSGINECVDMVVQHNTMLDFVIKIEY